MSWSKKQGTGANKKSMAPHLIQEQQFLKYGLGSINIATKQSKKIVTFFPGVTQNVT